MRAKFTPGPWVAIPTRTRLQCCDSRPIYNDGLWAILPESHLERIPLGVVDHGNDHDAPTRANAEADAKLMAAAPELLDALKLAESHYKQSENCGVCHPIGDCPTLRVISAAIAKAEARS